MDFKKVFDRKVYMLRYRLIRKIRELSNIQRVEMFARHRPELPLSHITQQLHWETISKIAIREIKGRQHIAKKLKMKEKDFNQMVFEEIVERQIDWAKQTLVKQHYLKPAKKGVKGFGKFTPHAAWVAKLHSFSYANADIVYDEDFDVEDLTYKYLIERAFGIHYKRPKYNPENTQHLQKVYEKLMSMHPAQLRNISKHDLVGKILRTLDATPYNAKTNIESYVANIIKGLRA